MCRPRLGRHINRHQPISMSADTRSILHRHSADTLPTLRQHYAHLVSSCYWVLSSLLDWEGLSVAVVLFWPSSPAMFMSFFQLCFFPRHCFYIRPSLPSEVAPFGACCFRRFVILREQKLIQKVGTTTLSSCHMDGFFSVLDPLIFHNSLWHKQYLPFHYIPDRRRLRGIFYKKITQQFSWHMYAESNIELGNPVV